MGVLRNFWAGLNAKQTPASIPTTVGHRDTPWSWMPAGAVDTSGIGDGGGNSAVFAVIRFKSHAFAEAPPRLFDRDDNDQWAAVPGSDVEKLLRRPNPFMTRHHAAGYIIYSTEINGTAYFWKRRSAAGRVVELWPLRPNLVTPLSGKELAPVQLDTINEGMPIGYDRVDADSFIAGYRYQPAGLEFIIAPSEIVKLYDLPDPVNPRVGAAPMATVLREVLADEEAGQFATALVKNMGVPGVIMSPMVPEGEGPDVEEAEDMRDQFQDRFSGPNRGKPYIVTGGPMNVDVVSFTPEQMDFKSVRRVPEERISAVGDVPAILAGLGAGLDRSTYANWREARESMTEDSVIPLWVGFGIQWTEALRIDFAFTDDEEIRYDLSNVRSLQPDKTDAATRMNTAIAGGWAKVSEGRSELGLTVEKQHEIFLRSASVMEVPDVLPTDVGAEALAIFNGGVTEMATIGERVTAATALIRAGFAVQAALEAVGLDPIEHLGLLPVTLRSEEAITEATV